MQGRSQNAGASSQAREQPQARQQQQQRRASPVRDSLDGETIFAVGEDGDKFSDDEDGSGEDEGLVKGRK